MVHVSIGLICIKWNRNLTHFVSQGYRIQHYVYIYMSDQFKIQHK